MYSHFASLLFALLVSWALPVASQLPPPGAVSVGGVAVDGGNTGSGGGGQGSDGGEGFDGGRRIPGTACRQNSVGSALARDNSFMTLIFDDLKAQIGPNVPAAKQRGYCTVDVKLNTPAGWSFAVDTCDYRGYCNLSKGVNGTVSAAYNFVSQSGRVRNEDPQICLLSLTLKSRVLRNLSKGQLAQTFWFISRERPLRNFGRHVERMSL